jgi:hypothetical protein
VCQALNRETKEMLWLWILGMTDLIIHCRSGTYEHQEDIILCNDEVQRLNPHIYNARDD